MCQAVRARGVQILRLGLAICSIRTQVCPRTEQGAARRGSAGVARAADSLQILAAGCTNSPIHAIERFTPPLGRDTLILSCLTPSTGNTLLASLDQLVELQDLDSRLARLHEELSRIPVRRQIALERRTRGDQQLEAAQTVLTDCETRQRQAESNLQDREALLSQLEGKQHQVKSNTAYTALLSEMDQTRGGISEVETALLEGMEDIEAARAELARLEELVAAERESLDAEEVILTQSEADLEARITALDKDRVRVCGNLGDDVLGLYQKILKRRQPALVLVTEELCTGCRVGIPPQDFIEILTAERLVTCMNCSRILLHPDKLRAQPA